MRPRLRVVPIAFVSIFAILMLTLPTEGRPSSTPYTSQLLAPPYAHVLQENKRLGGSMIGCSSWAITTPPSFLSSSGSGGLSINSSATNCANGTGNNVARLDYQYGPGVVFAAKTGQHWVVVNVTVGYSTTWNVTPPTSCSRDCDVVMDLTIKGHGLLSDRNASYSILNYTANATYPTTSVYSQWDRHCKPVNRCGIRQFKPFSGSANISTTFDWAFGAQTNGSHHYLALILMELQASTYTIKGSRTTMVGGSAWLTADLSVRVNSITIS